MLELIESIHARGASVRFMASGQSMYPAVRDGDVITVSPLAGTRVGRGEVVAFRNAEGDELVVHRVARVTPEGALIKGDNTLEADGVIPEAAICGVVTGVERGGRPLRWPDRRRHPLRARLYFAAYPTLWSIRQAAEQLGLWALSRVQRWPGYRALMSSLLRGQSHDVVVRQVADDCRDSAPARTTLEGIAGRRADAEVSDASSPLRVTLLIGGQSAAHVTLIPSPPGCPRAGWWITELLVRRRFWGLGVGAEVLRETHAALARDGATSLWVSVPREALREQEWFRWMGYTAVELPVGECDDEDAGRCVLHKRLREDTE
jgi:hypothetical protein